MTPFEINVLAGKEDSRLLEHIARMESPMFGRMSPGEQRTLGTLWLRLDQITDPYKKPPSAAENLLARTLADAILGPGR